ncbi:hypothetical protein [Streptomyces sp. NPDC001970]
MTTPPTVAQVIGTLAPGAPVRATVDRATSPGEIVLTASTQAAIDQDCRVIRAVERLGLHDGAVQ